MVQLVLDPEHPNIKHAATGALVRAARIHANVSLKSLAQALQISPGYLHDLENGRRSGWTAARIQVVNQVLADAERSNSLSAASC